MVANQGEIVHRTEWYVVRVGADGYEVANLRTGVVEATEKLLPQAILHAENTNSFMVNKLWRWVATQGKQQGEALDRSDDPLAGLAAVEEVDFDGPETVN